MLETDNLYDIICRNCERFIESALTLRNECFKTQHTLSTSYSIKRVISPTEQEHSTNVQNDCIKPTKKSLKFMEDSSSDISNHRDNTMIIDIKPFTPIDMTSTVSFVNEKFISVQHFPQSKPSLTTPNPELVSNFKNVMDESSVPPTISAPPANSPTISISSDYLPQTEMETLHSSTGVDPEIFKKGSALCRPPWLTGEKKFRFQIV